MVKGVQLLNLRKVSKGITENVTLRLSGNPCFFQILQEVEQFLAISQGVSEAESTDSKGLMRFVRDNYLEQLPNTNSLNSIYRFS